MFMVIAGTRYSMYGFNDFVEDYQKIAKPEFRNNAERDLNTVVEQFDLEHGDSVDVYLTDEESVDGNTHLFHFEFFADEIGIISYYGHEIIG